MTYTDRWRKQDEEKEDRFSDKKMIQLVAVVSLVLIVAAGVLLYFLLQAMNASARQQMTFETEEYKNRLFKQIEADFQNLETLSGFISEEMLEDEDEFAKRLEYSNEQNNFLTMAFFYPDGKGTISTRGLGTRMDVSYKNLNEAAHPVVEKAYEGEKSVSRLFYSESVNRRVFVYGVPVYTGEELAGVLTASDQIDIFTDILDGNTVLGGNGYLHLIGTEGDFLVKSKNAVVKEDLGNIFDGPYFDDDEKDMLKKEMQNNQRIFSSFRYHGERYQILLDPVGMHGWYLMCVSTLQESNQYSYPMLAVMVAAVACVLLVVVFLLFYGFRLARRSSRRFRYQAYHDSLTGAKNLTYFNRRLSRCLESGSAVSVVALNVHQFKFINEIFGREYADRLLIEIKEVLDKNMETGEFFARDRADLYYLCLMEQDREKILGRLQQIMDEIVDISSHHHNNYRILLYCGVVIQEEEKDVTPLMTHVMFALTTARGSYENNVWFYDSQLHEKEKIENYVETHMHQALRDGEFKMFLQPKTDLKTGRLKSAEALVRWIREDGSMIYPDQFIPLFENNGFCAKLDLYMVECACRQIREWMDRGLEPIGISVNQSKLLFYEKDYIEIMTELKERYGIPDQLITLEILEGLATENVEELNRKIGILRGQGFRISLDDFGSGYSSLNVLGNLRIDELKLDRGFLLEASDKKNTRFRAVMEEIVQLTKRLRISTVVEGIETASNEQFCCEIGCDQGQGYYYSRPLAREDFNRQYMKQDE